jgi:hypothetical protein
MDYIIESATLENIQLKEAYQRCKSYIDSIGYEWARGSGAIRDSKIIEETPPSKIVAIFRQNYDEYLSAPIDALVTVSIVQKDSDVEVSIKLTPQNINNYGRNSTLMYKVKSYQDFDLSQVRIWWVDYIRVLFKNIGVNMTKSLLNKLYPENEYKKRLDFEKEHKEPAMKFFTDFIIVSSIIIFIFYILSKVREYGFLL